MEASKAVLIASSYDSSSESQASMSAALDEMIPDLKCIFIQNQDVEIVISFFAQLFISKLEQSTALSHSAQHRRDFSKNGYHKINKECQI